METSYITSNKQQKFMKRFIWFYCAIACWLIPVCIEIYRQTLIQRWDSFRVQDILYCITLIILLVLVIVWKEKSIKLLFVPYILICALLLYRAISQLIFLNNLFPDSFYARISNVDFLLAYIIPIIFCLLLFTYFLLLTFNKINTIVPVVILCGLFIFVDIFTISKFLSDIIQYNSSRGVDVEFSSIISMILFSSYNSFLSIGTVFLIITLYKNEYFLKYNIQYKTLTKENIGINIFLSFITFGIYGLIWIYNICKQVKLFTTKEQKCSSEYACMIFVPFYLLYWFYTRAKSLYLTARNKNISINDNSTVCLVLSLFGFSIVSYALIQNNLNIIAENKSYDESYFDNNQDVVIRKIDKDPMEAIRELNELKKQGVISRNEFETKKKELLNRI